MVVVCGRIREREDKARVWSLFIGTRKNASWAKHIAYGAEFPPLAIYPKLHTELKFPPLLIYRKQLIFFVRCRCVANPVRDRHGIFLTVAFVSADCCFFAAVSIEGYPMCRSVLVYNTL